MKKNLILLATVLISLSWQACKQVSTNKIVLNKTKGGMPYELHTDPKKPVVKLGEFLKLHVSYYLNDSLLNSNEGKIPNYMPVTNSSFPYDPSELYASLRLGDSLVAVQLLDTFMKRSPGSIPPPFKKGDRLITRIKVLGIFENDSLHQIDAKRENELYKNREIAEVEQFVKKATPNALRTPNGAFVQILNPGNGNLIDSGKYVSVKYTGMTFDGKVFDSNIDPKFNHTDPLSFTVGAGQMIPGFDEGMRFLRPGGKAIVYMPSLLGYGAAGSGAIKGFSNLKFEIEVLSVQDKAPANTNMPQPTPGQ
jgi:FKBP-type peptidyl-prolyl cis-trans isomerase FkpA